jgi:hypothetical protein
MICLCVIWFIYINKVPDKLYTLYSKFDSIDSYDSYDSSTLVYQGINKWQVFMFN